MIKTETGIPLLRKNFGKVEEKFLNFFETREPRWPLEKHDFLRNHHKSLEGFSPTNISLDKLKVVDLAGKHPERKSGPLTKPFRTGEEYL